MSEFTELLTIVAILIIVFGARLIPALGEAIGRALHGGRTLSNAPATGGDIPTINSAVPDNQHQNRDGE